MIGKHRSIRDDLYDEFKNFGSEYHSQVSRHKEDLRKNLIDKSDIEAQKRVREIIEYRQSKSRRGCKYYNPGFQVMIDLIFMIICIVILLIQYRVLTGSEVGHKDLFKGVRERLNSFFGNPIVEKKGNTQDENEVKNMMNKHKNNVKTQVALKVKVLLLMNIVKPLFVYVVRAYKRKQADIRLFTEQTFMIRLFFDMFVTLPVGAEYYVGTSEFSKYILYILMIPLYLEIPIYFFSVLVAKNMNKNILFRTLRTRITTQNDNDQMWSTDEDELNEKERVRARANSLAIMKGVNESSSDAYDSDDQSADEIVFGQQSSRYLSRGDADDIDVSDDEQDKVENIPSSSEIKAKNASEEISNYWRRDQDFGPHDVFLRKKYKPVFIILVDLILAISFFIGSSIFYAMRLSINEDKTGTTNIVGLGMFDNDKSAGKMGKTFWDFFQEFIPWGTYYLQFMCFFKVYLDTRYLAQWQFKICGVRIKCFSCCACTKREDQNRSKTVFGLFMFRIFYDLIVFITYCKYFLHVSSDKYWLTQFQVFGVFVPVLLTEFIVYKLSVIPAYERAIYQEVSLVRKEEGKPVWLKGGENPNLHMERLDNYIAKKYRTHSVKRTLMQIGQGFEDKQDWEEDRFFMAGAFQPIEQDDNMGDQDMMFMPMVECSNMSQCCWILIGNVILPPLGTLFASIFDQGSTCLNFPVFINFMLQLALLAVSYKWKWALVVLYLWTILFGCNVYNFNQTKLTHEILSQQIKAARRRNMS